MNDEHNSEEYGEELSESGAMTGIEADNEEDEESILEPFDPDSISIEQKVVPMDTLKRRLQQGSIHLSPSFQRNEVWDATRRSRLVESLMLKVPLPMFYVAATEDGKWEVVDGLQRLSTIRDFLLGNSNGEYLKLKNLEFLGDKFDGKTFRAIENDDNQQKLVNGILETEMRFTVINPGTPEAVKRNIFKRINTGGMPLTSQEIRNALYQGPASKLLYKLVKSSYFEDAIASKINDTRMSARELILRFISFLIIDRSYYKSSMDTWLSNAMRIINCMPELEEKNLLKIYPKGEIPRIKISNEAELIDHFEIAMLRSEEIFEGHAFRKSLPGDYRKTPINKSLFETWSNIFCTLSNEQYNKVKINKRNLIKEYRLVLSDSDFVSAISRHSSMSSSVQYRYKKIEILVHRTINGE